MDTLESTAKNIIGNLPAEFNDALKKMPIYPEAAKKIAKIVSTGGSTIDLGRALASDPILTAKALKIANSAYYGFSRQISTPMEAVQVMGSASLGALASACALSVFNNIPKINNFNANKFFAHGLLTACLSKRLAKLIGFNDPELAFGAGLLHDVGGAILAISDLNAYCGCCHVNENVIPNLDEFKRHAIYGGAIAMEWNFQFDLVLGILTHHDENNATQLGMLINYCCKCSNLIENNDINGCLSLDNNFNLGLDSVIILVESAKEDYNRLINLLTK